MNKPFPVELKVKLREIFKSEPAVIALVEELKNRKPVGFDPRQSKTIESVALNSARSQGWEDCIEEMFVVMADEVEVPESDYLDTSKH